MSYFSLRGRNISDLRVKSLLAAAENYKDRLHSLQTTEWNIYYGIWALILAFAFFVISGTHTFLPDIADGIIMFNYSVPSVRLIRAAIIFFSISTLYFIIFRYYFNSFYEKNYESLVRCRTLFAFYLNTAICEAHGERRDAVSPLEFKYKIEDKQGLDQTEDYIIYCGRKFAYWIDCVARIKGRDGEKEEKTMVPEGWEIGEWGPEKFEKISRQIKKENKKIDDKYGITEILAPHLLDQLSRNYKSSKIYRGRKSVMRNFMIVMTVVTAIIGFLAPINTNFKTNKDTDLRLRVDNIDVLVQAIEAKRQKKLP